LLLERKGVNIEFPDEDGLTALTCAAFSGNKRAVQLLIEKGADVSARDRLGLTALGYVTERSNYKTAKLLRVEMNRELETGDEEKQR
jgi:ankyrin repeat protein